ncbi:MAG: hypothetical protein ACRDTJ_11000, partial [Pseudonocardiaceae bacterium]
RITGGAGVRFADVGPTPPAQESPDAPRVASGDEVADAAHHADRERHDQELWMRDLILGAALNPVDCPSARARR